MLTGRALCLMGDIGDMVDIKGECVRNEKQQRWEVIQLKKHEVSIR